MRNSPWNSPWNAKKNIEVSIPMNVIIIAIHLFVKLINEYLHLGSFYISYLIISELAVRPSVIGNALPTSKISQE